MYCCMSAKILCMFYLKDSTQHSVLEKRWTFHRLKRRESYRSKDLLHGGEEGERLGKEWDGGNTNSKYISFMEVVKDYEVLDIMPSPIATDCS